MRRWSSGPEMAGSSPARVTSVRCARSRARHRRFCSMPSRRRARRHAWKRWRGFGRSSAAWCGGVGGGCGAGGARGAPEFHARASARRRISRGADRSHARARAQRSARASQASGSNLRAERRHPKFRTNKPQVCSAQRSAMAEERCEAARAIARYDQRVKNMTEPADGSAALSRRTGASLRARVCCARE